METWKGFVEENARAFSEIDEVSSLRERSDPQTGRDSECAKIPFLHAFPGCANKGVHDVYMFHLLFVNTLPQFSWHKLEISDVFFFTMMFFFFPTQHATCYKFCWLLAIYTKNIFNSQAVGDQQPNTKELEVKDDQFVRCDPHQLQPSAKFRITWNFLGVSQQRSCFFSSINALEKNTNV